MVDVPLAHLDRPFDYLVTEAHSEGAQPGCRVRVRFAGQLVDAIVLERLPASEHEGRLAFLDRVVSAEPVVTDELRRLIREVADRWAGTFADVVRLALPPRHARAEAKPTPDAPLPPPPPDPAALGRYAGGAAVLAALAGRENPRVSWAALPGEWDRELAAIVTAVLAAERSVVVVVPDHRDVARLDQALTAALGPDQHVTMAADLGPAERYRRFLAARRGAVRCVLGTRSAVWAPVADLGAIVVWDDGDDLLAEQRAPYCHARDVAILRAHLADAAVVLGGHAVTSDAQQLVRASWLTPLDPTDDARAAALPRVRVAESEAGGDDPVARAARLPTPAWRAARAALAEGHPALVQVPRRGYQPTLSCATCRNPARCGSCAGPLARDASTSPPVCRWCATVATAWSCPTCGGSELRAVVVGARRTAEELGKAFPGVPIRTSGGDAVLSTVPGGASVVVCTPGAEPLPEDGYGAVLLLDGWAMLTRPELRAAEETLRRWLNAAALARADAAGGHVLVVAPAELRPVQALLRWAPRSFADREVDERADLHLPPVGRMAALTGTGPAVAELLELTELPPGTEVFGPVPAGGSGRDAAAERMLLRAPRRYGAQLARALRDAAAVRSARKAPDAVRVELDPQRLL